MRLIISSPPHPLQFFLVNVKKIINFSIRNIKIYGCNFQKFSVHTQNGSHYCKYYKDFLINFDKLLDRANKIIKNI